MKKETEMQEQELPQRQWYVATCVANKEKTVAERLRGLAQSNHMKDYLFRVFVASYKEINEKGKEKEVMMYKGKIFVEMILTPFSYGESRVTDFGFILPPKDPTPITEEEIQHMHELCGKTYYPYEEYLALVKDGTIQP